MMIRAKGVSKAYLSGRGRVVALDNVSFEIGKGATAVLFGKSGSGKTTLLNCAGGLERPESGCITVSGHDITAMAQAELGHFQRRHIGFVFQQGNLLPFLDAASNISFPLALNGASRKECGRRAQELLEMIGLGDAGKAMPGELSGGEMQRVAIARAIAHRPLVLLADEPTASLDSATGKSVIDLMFNLARHEGVTVMVSTHDPGIMMLADSSINLMDGKVVEINDSSVPSILPQAHQKFLNT